MYKFGREAAVMNICSNFRNYNEGYHKLLHKKHVLYMLTVHVFLMIMLLFKIDYLCRMIIGVNSC